MIRRRLLCVFVLISVCRLIVCLVLLLVCVCELDLNCVFAIALLFVVVFIVGWAIALVFVLILVSVSVFCVGFVHVLVIRLRHMLDVSHRGRIDLVRIIMCNIRDNMCINNHRGFIRVLTRNILLVCVIIS